MNKYMKKFPRDVESGFGLIEILIGMVIGLLALLAISQVVSTFEGQKRASTNAADAQTNGALALYTIQRWGQAAGYGLPIFDTKNQPLGCTAPIMFQGTTPTATDILPFQINDGGGGASDTLIIRTDKDPQSIGSPPLKVEGLAGNVVTTANTFTCKVDDIVLANNNGNCSMTTVTAVSAAPATITLHNAGPGTVTSAISIGGSIGCMRGWSDTTYAVAEDNLTELVSTLTTVTGAPVSVVSGIVNIQAQYGITATPGSDQIVNWVDATGPFASPISPLSRQLIRAVRVAVVARSAEYEKTAVSTPCSSTTAASPTGVCAWDGSTFPAPAVTINNPADGTDWHRYRYRVFETIIPLRNMIWL
jgi:type IV pilus assembly protein PilW